MCCRLGTETDHFRPRDGLGAAASPTRLLITTTHIPRFLARLNPSPPFVEPCLCTANATRPPTFAGQHYKCAPVNTCQPTSRTTYSRQDTIRVHISPGSRLAAYSFHLTLLVRSFLSFVPGLSLPLLSLLAPCVAYPVFIPPRLASAKGNRH